MLQSTLSGSSVPGLGGRERVIWRYGLVLYDYEGTLILPPVPHVSEENRYNP